MIQNQKSLATKYNRYPEIFRDIKQILPSPKQILSFGCSTGKECNTLHELYYPNFKIIGLDIDKKVIKDNIEKNKYKNIEYYSTIDNINEKSDLISANSVLCSWPAKFQDKYNFETFENTLEIIDSLLNKGGYLCIYNSKYLFCETNLFNKKYEKINTPYKKTGFVTKYHKNNEKIDKISGIEGTDSAEWDYQYFLFRKKEF